MFWRVRRVGLDRRHARGVRDLLKLLNLLKLHELTVTHGVRDLLKLPGRNWVPVLGAQGIASVAERE